MPTPETVDATTREAIDALDPTCSYELDPATGEVCDVLATRMLGLSCGHVLFFCEPHAAEYNRTMQGLALLCKIPAKPRHPYRLVSWKWFTL